MAKHARPSRTVAAAGAATAGALLAGAALAGAPAHAAVQQHASPAPPRTEAAVVPAPVRPPALRRYKVRPGDTLSGIAQRFCGSAGRWPALWRASKIRNPNLIYPGQLVTLACRAILARVIPPPPAPAPPGTTEQGGPLPSPSPVARVTGSQGVIGGGALRALAGLVRERIDEGQDFSGTGPLYAVAPGTVTEVYGAGWPGGVYINEQLDHPVDGFGYVYYAEDITPAVHPGERVGGSTVLGTVYRGGSGIELGWGTAREQTPAAHGHYADGVPTSEGASFAAFMASRPGTGGGGPRHHRHHHHARPTFTPAALPALASRLSAEGYDGPALAATAVYLRGHGYTVAAAAGVDGCIAGESGGSPESAGSGGGGLIGWTPLPAGLVTGSPARDLAVQDAQVIAYDNANGGVSRLNAEPGPAAAADLYSSRFERPAVQYSDVRYGVAAEVYAALGG